MKKLIFLLLFLIVLSGFILGSFYPKDSIELQLNSAVKSSNIELENSEENNLINSPIFLNDKIKIDSQQLYEYLTEIVGERSSDFDRAYIQNYLVEKLQSFGFSPRLYPFETGVNIWAEKKGNNPDAGSFLIAAHYDTVINSPGADDNGTGIAVILEIARLLKNIQTPLTFELAFFDQEETGLLGSFAFVNQTENLDRLKSVIILDMVGYACHTSGCQTYPAGLSVDSFLKTAGVESPDKGEFIAVVGEAEHLDLLKVFQKWNKITTDLPPIVTVPVPLKGVLTPDVLRSDHAAFWYKGIPAVLVTDTAELRSSHYHQPSDTIDTLDKPFFIGSAQLILNIVQDLLTQN
ncbi:MAG: M28 family peptidase [Microcoleaceae cyanobacterium]